MCEYCTINDRGYGKIPDDMVCNGGDYGTSIFMQFDDGVYSLADGDRGGDPEIYYCPWCGRKLSD